MHLAAIWMSISKRSANEGEERREEEKELRCRLTNPSPRTLMEPEEACAIFAQTCSAIKYIHERKILHRWGSLKGGLKRREGG